MALPKGTLLKQSRYQIQRMLARGGYGFIYLASDQLTGRQVVLKELIPALVTDADALRRFIREGRTLQRLSHAHIVRTEAMFKENSNHYIVQEYVAGGTLADQMTQGRVWSLSETLDVAQALINALSYLHQMGITHCDLQPSNILLDADGTPKLTDLGIAHISDLFVHRAWRTENDLAIGTVLYMSPEQLEGVRDDARVDLYALGALLYQMLAGRHYLDFDQRNTPLARADNVNRVRHETPKPISDIPFEVNRVLLKALAKNPADRYATVEIFFQELVRAALPYLPAGDGKHLFSAFDLEYATGFASSTAQPEWPRWIWTVLALMNISVMLLVAFLILASA